METSKWKEGYETAVNDMTSGKPYASFEEDETEKWKAGYDKAIKEKQDLIIKATYYHHKKG